STPLPQVATGGVEHDHAVIAIAVGDVDAAALAGDRIPLRVDVHVRGLVQQRVALVGGRVGPGVAARVARRIVADTARPYLQQQLRAVMLVFLHDAVAVTRDPD